MEAILNDIIEPKLMCEEKGRIQRVMQSKVSKIFNPCFIT